jgi:hypothetical protein
LGIVSITLTKLPKKSNSINQALTLIEQADGLLINFNYRSHIRNHFSISRIKSNRVYYFHL